jgi:hypothetical protein
MSKGGPTSQTAEPKVHSHYADGTLVMEGDQAARIVGPHPLAVGCAHSVVRWDPANQRVYQAREFDAPGRPVRDIDFTNTTYPNGRPRPGHPGPPHQHRWIAVDPANPQGGFRRGGPEPWPGALALRS